MKNIKNNQQNINNNNNECDKYEIHNSNYHKTKSISYDDGYDAQEYMNKMLKNKNDVHVDKFNNELTSNSE